MPRSEEGRRNSEGEQEQGKTSQLLMIPAPGGFSEGAPASGMELDLPRVRGTHGECGGAGNSGTAKDGKKISVKFAKSTFHGKGCTPG